MVEKTSVEKLAEYKADLLIGGYKSIEEACDVLEAECAAAVKPLKAKMQEILGALTIKADAEGVKNFSSEYGLFCFTNFKKVKVASRAEWFPWVKDHDAWDCMTAHVAKDEVIKRLEEMRETAKQEAEGAGELARYDATEINIPGLEIEDCRTGHIRKAT